MKERPGNQLSCPWEWRVFSARDTVQWRIRFIHRRVQALWLSMQVLLPPLVFKLHILCFMVKAAHTRGWVSPHPWTALSGTQASHYSMIWWLWNLWGTGSFLSFLTSGPTFAMLNGDLAFLSVKHIAAQTLWSRGPTEIPLHSHTLSMSSGRQKAPLSSNSCQY